MKKISKIHRARCVRRGAIFVIFFFSICTVVFKVRICVPLTTPFVINSGFSGQHKRDAPCFAGGLLPSFTVPHALLLTFTPLAGSRPSAPDNGVFCVPHARSSRTPNLSVRATGRFCPFRAQRTD